MSAVNLAESVGHGSGTVWEFIAALTVKPILTDIPSAIRPALRPPVVDPGELQETQPDLRHRPIQVRLPLAETSLGPE